MLESYFSKAAELHHRCFPVDFQENVRTSFLQNNCELLLWNKIIPCLELKKEGVNIGHQLSCWCQELLQKRQSSDFLERKKGASFAFKFLLEVSFRYQFEGFMLKEHL